MSTRPGKAVHTVALKLNQKTWDRLSKIADSYGITVSVVCDVIVNIWSRILKVKNGRKKKA